MTKLTATAGATATAFCILLLAGCSPSDAGTAPRSPAVRAADSVTPSASGPPDGQATCPNPHGGNCLGPLEPGQYQTATFQPAITYTVPAGWTNFEDLPGNFWLFQQEDEQEGALGGSYLGIYQNIHAAAINCDEAWEEGIGTTPTELVAWYQSVPGLVVSEPKSVNVGGLDGLQIDLGLEPGVDTCRYDTYEGIPLIIGDGVSDVHHVILPELDLRLVILGWRDGNVTLEITNVKEQHSADEFRAVLQPIIDSLEFES
jgi:hypothetical protein